jgi:hypothetical protein
MEHRSAWAALRPADKFDEIVRISRGENRPKRVMLAQGALPGVRKHC